MVSIQISLNGLSFYDTKRSKVWQSQTTTIDKPLEEQTIKLRKLSNSALITTATDNFVMIPANLYLPQDIELYFAAKLLPYNTEQFEYIVTTVKDIIFITAIEIDLITLFSNTFTTLTLTHPLEQTIQNNPVKKGLNGIYIFQIDKRCAISLISNGKLLFSDYLKIASNLDIAYYLKKLINDTGENNTTIYCLGTNQKQTAESLSPYFKKIDYTK